MFGRGCAYCFWFLNNDRRWRRSTSASALGGGSDADCFGGGSTTPGGLSGLRICSGTIDSVCFCYCFPCYSYLVKVQAVLLGLRICCSYRCCSKRVLLYGTACVRVDTACVPAACTAPGGTAVLSVVYCLHCTVRQRTVQHHITVCLFYISSTTHA